MLLLGGSYAQELNLSQKMDDQPREKVLEVALLKHYPVFLIFYSIWCAECGQYLPVIKEIEKTWGDKILFIKVNVEDGGNLALVEKYKEKYNFTHLPFTLVYNKNGEIFKNFIRSKTQKELEEITGEILKF